MERMIPAVWVPLVLLLAETAMAQPEDHQAEASEENGKWSLSLSAAATNAAIRIVDSEIELPVDLAPRDFEASLSDDLSVSSTIVSASVGYRILPFAEVYARGGLIASETETGVTLTGTPTGRFTDVFNGPITLDRETSQDVDGYSLGLGANAALPITEISGDTLAAYGGFQYVWNRLDEDVSSEGATTSFGLLYPVSLDRQNLIWRAGGSYNWISRDVEQALTVNGEPVRVRVTQEFEDPWAVEAGVGIPLGKDTLLGLGVWHQLSGETSALASVTYRLGTRK